MTFPATPLKEKKLIRNAMRLVLSVGVLFGCAAAPQKVTLKDDTQPFDIGQIISAATGEAVSFDHMVADLSDHRIVYIGENHTNSSHHDVQLTILQALFGRHSGLKVGMEMFDVTYQPVLDQWSEGQLDQEAFIQKTHWYANWRYNFALYKDILDFIKDNRIALIGLNIPFHIPRKIRIGGTDSLLGCDRQFLPDNIDTTNTAHREHLETIFNRHRFHGEANFEFFYQAQCVWEDGMASSVARHEAEGMLVALVGNGHIIHRFGIPERAYKRTGTPYRTVYLASPGETVERSYADYIYVTAPSGRSATP